MFILIVELSDGNVPDPLLKFPDAIVAATLTEYNPSYPESGYMACEDVDGVIYFD